MFIFFLLRMFRRRNLSPQQRRRRIIRFLLIYVTIFLLLGIILLILDLTNHNNAYQVPMMVCFIYAAIQVFILIMCVVRYQGVRGVPDDRNPLIGGNGGPQGNDMRGHMGNNNPYNRGVNERGEFVGNNQPNYNPANANYNQPNANYNQPNVNQNQGNPNAYNQNPYQ